MRLDRARHHLDDFERIRQGWLDSMPALEPMVTPRAGDESLWEVRFAPLPRMPMSFTLIVSDAVQNIRIALDYAASAIVRRCGGDTTNSHFPVCRKVDWWPRAHRKNLPNVGEPWLSLIRTHQPFTGSPSGQAFDEIALLSNVDKHQFLIPHYALTRFDEPRLKEGEDAFEVEEVRVVGETGYHHGSMLGYLVRMSRPGVRPPSYAYPAQVSYRFGQFTNGWPGPDLDSLRHSVDVAQTVLESIEKSL